MVEIVDQITKSLNSGGLLPALIFAVICLAKGWVVPKATHDAVLEQNRDLRKLVDRLTATNDAALGVAEGATRAVVERQHG